MSTQHVRDAMVPEPGTLDVSVNGHHTQTIDVAGVPRLYTLYQAQAGSAAETFSRR